VYDFNGHIRQSGLFWIVQVPDSAVTMNGDKVSVHLTEANVVDNGVFAGPKNDFAAATFDITWNATGSVQHFRPASSDPIDPTNFADEFRSATVTGSLSVVKGGTTFTASGTEAFAEIGTERNGFFLQH